MELHGETIGDNANNVRARRVPVPLGRGAQQDRDGDDDDDLENSLDREDSERPAAARARKTKRKAPPKKRKRSSDQEMDSDDDEAMEGSDEEGEGDGKRGKGDPDEEEKVVRVLPSKQDVSKFIKSSQATVSSIVKQAARDQTRLLEHDRLVEIKREKDMAAISQAEKDRIAAERTPTMGMGFLLSKAAHPKKVRKLNEPTPEKTPKLVNSHGAPIVSADFLSEKNKADAQTGSETAHQTSAVNSEPIVEQHSRDKCYLCISANTIVPKEMEFYFTTILTDIALGVKRGYAAEETAKAIYSFQESTMIPNLKKRLTRFEFEHFVPRMSERALVGHLNWLATTGGEIELFLTSSLVKLKELYNVCMERSLGVRQKLLQHEQAGTVPSDRLIIDKGEIHTAKSILDQILHMETILAEDRFAMLREKSASRSQHQRSSSHAMAIRESSGIKIEYSKKASRGQV